jgi:hypothetical protein
LESGGFITELEVQRTLAKSPSSEVNKIIDTGINKIYLKAEKPNVAGSSSVLPSARAR